MQAAEPATVADRVTIVFEMRVEASFQGGPVIDSTGRLMGLVTSDFRPAPDTLAARQASAAIDSATPASRVQPLSAGVRATSPFQDPQAPDGTFVSDAGGYTLQVPPGWRVDPSGDGKVLIWEPITGTAIAVDSKTVDEDRVPNLPSIVLKVLPEFDAAWSSVTITSEQWIQAGKPTSTHSMETCGPNPVEA